MELYPKKKQPYNQIELWARPDSNRRPPPCKGDVIPLDHEPDNLLMSPFVNNKIADKSL